jgi:hypothetical protein
MQKISTQEKRGAGLKMKKKIEAILELDNDFTEKRAKEMGLYKLRLKLPEDLVVTGICDFNNSVLVRRQKPFGA